MLVGVTALGRAGGLLERGEVQVVGGCVVDSVAGEDAEGGECMAVGVVIQKATEGLRRRDHCRHGLFQASELRLEELPRRLVRRAAEVAVLCLALGRAGGIGRRGRHGGASSGW